MKSREQLDLILAAFSEKPVGIGAFVWLWLFHNWFSGLATDPSFRRLFFLACMSGVSLPWHNVRMSGWQRSGLVPEILTLDVLSITWKTFQLDWETRFLGRSPWEGMFILLVTTCWIYEYFIVCLLVQMQKCRRFVQAHVGSRHKEQQLERTVYCKNM